MSILTRLFVLTPVLLLGCHASFAPPVRATHYGAPGKLAAGQVSIGGSAGGPVLPVVGGPNLGIGFADWASMDGGASLTFVTDYGWATGYAGPRFTWSPHPERRFRFAGDIEAGAGIGAGGARGANEAPSEECPDCDGRAWSERLALGGYQGIGAGFHVDWFALYGRVRVEESAATNVPVTFWPSAMLGAEFKLGRRASLGIGGGFIGYVNETDTAPAGFLQLDATIFFDAFGRASRSKTPAFGATPAGTAAR